ncbi:MAG: hypothetical protein GY834_07430, partial [Bacteroidetes bacterium]|nr:hypothetical protein [Bacteroidota bacterium]
MKNKLFVYLFGVLFAVLILLPATNVTVHADEDWSGLYMGAYVGYLSANPDHEEQNNPKEYLDPDIESFNRGLLVGYNFQTSSLVYGIEADYGFVNANEGPNINLYGN